MCNCMNDDIGYEGFGKISWQVRQRKLNGQEDSSDGKNQGTVSD